MAPLIELDHAWKWYPKGGFLRRALHILLPHRTTPARHARKGWVLRDVSFRLGPGQSLGVIGPNGAGKTTLLRLLAGITRATAGTVRVQGRTAALVALGAGFHQELTGRENIYLNGVILGLTRAQIRERFHDIVDFAELGDSIDVPVKFYSSGMHARLGFSVAVHVEPEVLLIDEILSVGDQSFQSKSLQRMLSFRQQGCAIVFVSHRLPAVSTMCQETLWLDRGSVRMLGPTEEVIRSYAEETDRQLVGRIGSRRGEPQAAGEVAVHRVVLRNGSGHACESFRTGDSLTVELHYQVRARIVDPYFLVIVSQAGGENLFGANMLLDGFRVGTLAPGEGILRCTFQSLPLLPGSYFVSPQVKRDISGDAFAARPMAAFTVGGRMADYGFKGSLADSKVRGSTSFHVPYAWRT